MVAIEEPGSDDLAKSTPQANYLRDVIKNGSLRRDPEINVALFSAARKEIWQSRISPALGSGAYVLSARNYLSTLAYQGQGEGVDEDHILEVTKLFTGDRYLHPDHMLVLTLDDERERTQRIDDRGTLAKPDTFEMRGVEFQRRVNQAYVDLALKYGIPTVSCLQNGYMKTREEIQMEVRAILSL